MAEVTPSIQALTSRFLGREMYLIVTRPVRGPGIDDQRLAAHLEHQIKLEKQGILFAAGPLYSPGSSSPEAGMLVLRAKSFEEAQAIAAEDPLHKAGLRKFTVQKWRINEGSYTVTVNYSDQTVQIA